MGRLLLAQAGVRREKRERAPMSPESLLTDEVVDCLDASRFARMLVLT